MSNTALYQISSNAHVLLIYNKFNHFYRWIHDNVDERIPEDRALGELKREHGEVEGDGVGVAGDARQGEDSVGSPTKQKHEYQHTNLQRKL